MILSNQELKGQIEHKISKFGATLIRLSLSSREIRKLPEQWLQMQIFINKYRNDLLESVGINGSDLTGKMLGKIGDNLSVGQSEETLGGQLTSWKGCYSRFFFSTGKDSYIKYIFGEEPKPQHKKPDFDTTFKFEYKKKDGKYVEIRSARSLNNKTGPIEIKTTDPTGENLEINEIRLFQKEDGSDEPYSSITVNTAKKEGRSADNTQTLSEIEVKFFASSYYPKIIKITLPQKGEIWQYHPKESGKEERWEYFDIKTNKFITPPKDSKIPKIEITKEQNKLTLFNESGIPIGHIPTVLDLGNILPVPDENIIK
jgi:hypothetical protein